MRRLIYVSFLALFLVLFGVASAEDPNEFVHLPSVIKNSKPGSATETISPTDTPALTATATVSETPAPTLTESPTPTLTATVPVSGTNLIVNGQFQDKNGNASFDGWDQTNGYWANFEISPIKGGLHDPIPCGESGSWLLQMDRDLSPLDTWPPPPSEDWAYQDILSPGPHTTLFLHYEEAHHMADGIIQLTIYGRVGTGSWEIVYQQLGVRSPLGTGKCDQWGPPATYDEIIPVAAAYDEYRLEIYGKLLGESDGVLWGDFQLSTDN